MDLSEARIALNANADDVADVLWRVWHLLDGAHEHGMAAFKLGRAKNATWRDPVATFEIERHGDPAGQIQFWEVNLVDGNAKCVYERPLRARTPALQRQQERPLAVELASLIRAGEEDPRLRWENEREVKVLAASALGAGATSEQAKRLREAIAKELGDAWVRERGLFVRVLTDPARDAGGV